MNPDDIYLCIISTDTSLWCLQISGCKVRVDVEDGDNVYLRNIGNIAHFHTLLTTEEQNYQFFPESSIL
jgi:hypothetical protein